jgi:ornithine carbamoyltransferase
MKVSGNSNDGGIIMNNNLKGRSLLTLLDYSPEEIRYLLDLSKTVKQERKSGAVSQRFLGKTIALIFEKRSTRTRCAFETAFGEEGGHPVFLSTADIQLGAKESIEDTARVLGRMFDAIQFRGFSQKTVEILAQYSGVPVYNGLTDLFHPTQALADILTLEEAFGDSRGKTLCYVGDGRNNVARSLMVICAKLGVNISIVSPAELFPDQDLIDTCKKIAADFGSQITVTNNIDAVSGAHAIYTDVWVSMGEEDKTEERKALLSPYKVTKELIAKSGKPDTIFLHCLPAIKDMEVSLDVIEGTASRVWDQAENRKHTIKALMLATI